MNDTAVNSNIAIKRIRSLVLIACSTLIFVLLLLRFFFIQVAQQDHYLRLSNNNRLKALPIHATRGLIFDRNGKLLVDNKASYSVAAIPLELRTKGEHEVVKKAAMLLGLEEGRVLKTIERRKRRSFEPITLKRNVDFRTLSILEENIDKYPGIIYQVDPRRAYVYGMSAAHLLGYTGEMSEAESKRMKKEGYLYGEQIGKTGLEKQYEKYLRGVPGIRYVEVNAVGKKINELKDKYTPPEAGSNLYLTLDIDLQQVAEQAFSPTLRGALVAMDPRTGEILALLSRPAYDPNVFSVALSNAQWKALNTVQQPLLNRALQGLYPPGSTMKMLTALAALETGAIDRHTLFSPCHGAYRFGTSTFRCWKSAGHGRLDVHEALVNSCNVYFYQVAQKLGLRNWSTFARFFGLHQKTGIDLPGEVAGLVPQEAYFNKKYGKNGFTKGQMLNLAIGQGDMLSTPIELASYTAILANGGNRVTPYLMKRVVSSRGGTIATTEPHIVPITAVTSLNYELIKDAMQDVIVHRNGTAHACNIPGIKIAGKTGSAENSHGRTHALFTAFAPADNPTIVITVIVENAGHGGSIAAPIARRVFEQYFNATLKAQ